MREPGAPPSAAASERDAGSVGGLRPLLFPMALVVAPQTALAAIQHGLSVLGPEMTRAAGLPPHAIGLIGGLSGAGAVCFFAASDAIIRPLGPVRALAAGCLLAALAVCAILTGHPALLLGAAPFVGFAYAATAPAGSAILAERTPRRLWGTLFSIRMAGVPAGGAIAGVAAAGLVAVAGWRAGLASLALLPLACALFLILADAREDRRPLVLPRLRRVLSAGNLAAPFRALRRSPRLARLTAASLGFAAVQSSAFTFLTTYLTESFGLSLALAGSLFATMQVASFAGRVAVGFVADAVGSNRIVLTTLGLASALGALMLALAPPGLPILALFFGAALVGSMIATWNGLFLAEVASVAAADDVGTATSAATFFTFIGYMITPPLFAAISTATTYSTAYICVAFAAVAAALLVSPSSRSE